MHKQKQRELLKFIQTKLIKDRSPKISADTVLFQGQLLNSMNILNLIGYVENRIGRRLADGEIVMSNFQSVKAIMEAFFHENAKLP